MCPPFDLFPTEGPLAESRQIGRRRAIDDLQRELADRRRNLLLLEPRRVGKTSVARAALAHVREEAGIALDLDLSESSIGSVGALARELAAQARAAGVGVHEMRRRLGVARRAATKVSALGAHGVEVAHKLGVDVNASVADALTAVQDVLSSVDAETDVRLGDVLIALELAAQASRNPLIVFLDECHRLLEWGVAQEQLDFAMRRQGRRLVFLFAGSDQRALGELFAEGRPLHRDGLRWPLPPIPDDDWIPALIERFADIDRAISPAGVRTILDASGRHPQRTMQICAHAQRWCDDTRQSEVSDQIIANAIDDARGGQPSWDS